MSIPRRPNEHEQEYFRFGYEHASPFTKATATITCVSNANMDDNDTVTINDGFRIVVYEYDKAADGVSAGTVAWAVAGGAAGAIEAAGTLKTAIEANQPGITVTDNADGTLTLTANWPGAAANKTITESVTNAGFLVSGFTGGTDPLAGHAGSLVVKQTVAPRPMRIDEVEYINPTGFSEHADNYWELRLLQGNALVVADFTFTAEADDDLLTRAAHGLETGDGPIRVANSGGGLPTGLAAATDYWVIKASSSTFKLATSLANALSGTAINITGDGTGTQTLSDTANTQRQTLMAQWSTDDAAEGTLTANAAVNLTLSATDANLVVPKDGVLSIALIKVASAANLPAGRFVVHGRYV